ncbi:ABC transporter permease [Peribacillus cavernae]|uniref:ABC transporter permease n=1 Tax=Peribacillus cavernae TaxID=1674310 RepID=A0A433HEC2_9BACI|nr:ABC transporter permease [Peribacillus cavernae]MDQ0219858.1 putative spermidine/putrescine transport system permease protein/spermidine/putrescine transport system permease protein [Peribacillus cavernae]RUQ26650.1 ABC transporter permease [Peribacillus cavernae]
MATEVKTDPRVPVKRVSPAYRLTRIPGLQWLLLLVPFAYILFLVVFSIIGFFKLSIYDETGFTLQYLTHMFTETVYLQVLWVTLKIAAIVTVISLLLAYPVAYLLVKVESKKWKSLIMGAVLIPFWISLLVRTFAWTMLLQEQGIINKLLISVGILQEPIPLLYNTAGVVIGMTHVLLPYMVLSLYAVMEGIDQRLVQAAQGMGARPWKAFIQIFFPLSLTGVLSGSLLVFVQGLGYFITPALLGGPDNMMISVLIQRNVSETLNWHLASAIALLLFIVTLLVLLISFFFLRNNPVLKEVE